MKIETIDLEDRQLQITVEVPGENLQAAMRTAAKRLSRETRIPGFRPGKAPYEMVLNRLGEAVVFEEALDTLGQEIYRQALEDSDVEPYAPGRLEEVISQDPLVLRYTVPLAPDVDIGNYLELRIPYEEPKVSDEVFEETLENLRQSRALIEPVNREAQLSDVVVLDIHADLKEPEDEEDQVIIDVQGIEVLVEEETDWPVPGIHDHLIGMNTSDERQFDHTFGEDYSIERLRQREAIFQLTCQEIKSRYVPVWTDELARNIGEFEDLLDLRLKVREELTEGVIREAEAEYSQLVIDTAVEGSTVDYPPILLTEEIEQMVSSLERRLASQNMTLDDYNKIESKTMEELRSELEPKAQERLIRALVMGKLVELEDMKVEDQEISDQIDRMVSPFEDQADELRKAFDTPQSRHRVALDLLTSKAVKRIVAISKGDADLAESPSQGTVEDTSSSVENSSE